ncbi:hypothetical protein PsalN5692_02894 [Piscirickettsia salmonis]|uniref:hypothetical protein n=1 Tax=Piscirickettsia salmonis TaxID=1238 RepID=UPI00205C71F6|nr:hypothetical protein PsalN5692_02894 [Piscirickettsia salmonis]
MFQYIRDISQSGRFGKVILAKDKTGNKFAVKLFRMHAFKPDEINSSAKIEVSNFNCFSDNVTNIGQAKSISITDIVGLDHITDFQEKAMLMPFFHNERDVSYEEIKPYISDLANADFFMGDPKPNNFFYTKRFGLIPIDYGLIFKGSSPNLYGLYRLTLVNAPFNYKDAFGDPFSGVTSKKYHKLRKEENLLFFDQDGEHYSANSSHCEP